MTNTFSLQDVLSRSWRHELLAIPVCFSPGELPREQVSVVSESGERVPGQLVEVRYHPDGSVAEAVCWFHGDLPAGTRQTWRVTPDSTPPKTDLTLEREAGGWVISNAHLGLRVPDGSQAGAPPLLALCGAEGVWRGAGRWQGAVPQQGPVVEVGASGPVFAEVTLAYQRAEGGAYHVTVTVYAGEPALLVHERCSLPEQGALVFDLGRSFERGTWRPHRPSRAKTTDPEDYRGATYQNYPLDFAERSTNRLQPFFSWAVDTDSWFALHSRAEENRDWWGIFTSRTDDWRGGQYAALRVETGPEGAALHAPLGAFERWWGLVVARREQALATEHEASNPCYEARVRLGDLPLRRVAEFSLRWERSRESYRTHALVPPGQEAALREKATTWTAFRDLFAARAQPPGEEGDPAGAYLATGDTDYALAARDRVLSRLRRWVEHFLTRGYAFHELVAISLSRELRRTAVDWDLVASCGLITDEERRWADAAFSFLACCMTEPHYWPPDERGFWKGNVNFYSDHYTCVATLAALLEGHPRRGEWLSWAAGLLNDEFRRWAHPSGAWEEAPNYQGGTMLFLIPTLRLLRLAEQEGFTEAETLKATMRCLGLMQTPLDPRRRTAMLPTIGDTSFSFHSQSQQNVFAWAAALYPEDEEFAGTMMWHWQRGGALVCGVHDTVTIGRWAGALLLIDPELPAQEPPGYYQSRRLEGYGALLRYQQSNGEDNYLLVKCGPAFNHYDPDELSFHWYARGVPLALDYGCMYEPNSIQSWYHNRISVDHRTDVMPYYEEKCRGQVTDFTVLPASTYFAGEAVIPELFRVPEKPSDPILRADYPPPEKVPPTIWQRQILMSPRADYVVVNDTLEGELPTDWSLHVLAESVEANERGAHFAGQLGVDLEVCFDGEPSDRVETGEWGYLGRDPSDEDRLEQWRNCTLDLPVEVSGETQRFVRLWRGPGRGYRALLLPRRAGDPPVTAEPRPWGFSLQSDGWDDQVFLCGSLTWVEEDTGLNFRGRAALVRREGPSTTLCLISGDRLKLGPLGIQARGPLSLTWDGERWQGQSGGEAKRVQLTWPLQPGLQPRLRVDGQPHPAAHHPIAAGREPVHLLVFTLPAGEHHLEIRP